MVPEPMGHAEPLEAWPGPQSGKSSNRIIGYSPTFEEHS